MPKRRSEMRCTWFCNPNNQQIKKNHQSTYVKEQQVLLAINTIAIKDTVLPKALQLSDFINP